MKKLILLAAAAILMFSGCEKNSVVIGNGTVSCAPSSLTLKVGETQSFTFVCHDSKITDLTWRSSGDASTFSYPGSGNTIYVTGKTAGEDIIMCYNTLEASSTKTILGGVTVYVKN